MPKDDSSQSKLVDTILSTSTALSVPSIGRKRVEGARCHAVYSVLVKHALISDYEKEQYSCFYKYFNLIITHTVYTMTLVSAQMKQ